MKKIYQFGYRFSKEPLGMPVIDCRGIDNPFSKRNSDAERRKLVRKDPKFESLVQDGVKLLGTWQSIAVGCAFGVHRSGEVAKEIAARTGAKIELIH